MSWIDKLTKTVIQAIDERDKKKTHALDTIAEVKRVDGSTAWVKFAGATEETPVRMTINVHKGDKVQVRASKGSAWIVGNETAPPTDDTVALQAEQKAIDAYNRVSVVETVVEDTVPSTTIWTSSQDPTIPNYTFDISLLSGTEGAVPKVGDFIMSSVYRYTIEEVGSTTVRAGSRVSYKGEAGEDGTSVTILGSYNTLADLQAAHPTGSTGDAYLVGGDLYVWNGSAWEDVGTIQGPQGPQGATGATGPQGPQGNAGVSITGVTEYYLATSASSGVTTSTSGWTTTVQSMSATNQYLWNYEQVIGTGGVTLNTTSPCIIGRYGQNGTNGRGISSITEYYLATSLSSGVTTSTSGWTTAVQSTTTTNKYLWNYEVVTYTDGNTSTTSPCIIGTHGATGPAGANGTNGTNGISITSTQQQYALHTSNSPNNPPTSGWSDTPQDFVHGKYYWTREHIYFSDNTSGYSSPVYNAGLTDANEQAYAAKTKAEGINQYFWTKSTSGTTAVPTGSYVTEIPQASFDDSQGGTPAGGNLLLQSSAVKLRLADKILAELTGTQLTFKNSNGDDIASFGDNATIGRTTSSGGNVYITNSGISFRLGTTVYAGLSKYNNGLALAGDQLSPTGAPRIELFNSGVVGNVGIYSGSSGGWITMNTTNSKVALSGITVSGAVNITGNTDITGTLDVTGKLLADALTSSLFATSDVDISIGGSSSSGNLDNTKSASKTGYYPLGIVGTKITSGGAYSRGFYLSSCTTGSCTVNGRIYASSTGAKSCTVTILWLKVTA